MTPGNNGASTPEDDDPFGYLYADGQANGAQPPSGGYGYPNSVNRVRPVGTRQYGAPQAQAPQQQGVYGQPNAHYAAPETAPGAPGPQQGRAAGGGRGRGPNTKGLLIGAIAVVAAVVVGIAVAMASSGDKDDDKGGNEAGASAPAQPESGEPSATAEEEGEKDEKEAELPASDAKALRLSPGLSTSSDTPGAQAEGGVYVAGFNQVGAKVTWTVDGIKDKGSYRLYVQYGIPGVDANATLVVNGKADSRPLNMRNFAKSPEGDWEKGWQNTWANVNLNQGTNTIELACNEGNQCDVNLDQVWLKPG
ncbi:CBM35 domain-containing protein [Streptomyces tagetis]|uniref:Carbohydrate-binding protein n=1 Tax=Streptomyces tagetis TaxID=2820809 RepID=A0A940XKQ7_9ACTN|nr:CBM35 domain-containing protein [Streptomyces sp. RG38]MBQ0829267.1 carbohydrate-binding protein [Streptomyces sp. RG38]